jgi:hypothetical protein
MKILIRNSDNIVFYAQSDLVLDTELHGDNWRDPNFNTTNATLAEATLPSGWTGAIWSYIDGVWAVADQDAYDRLQQAHADQIAAQVRQARNAKLTETDWRFRSDMTPAQSWKDYCQALRDIPAQAGFPLAVVWPAYP